MVTAGFEEAVAPLIPRMRALAVSVTGDASLADDAVQEALLRAYRFWGQRKSEGLWPWLQQVLRRECWRAARRSRRTGHRVEGEIPVPGPEESAIVAEEHAEVRRALERMPAGYRSVLRLRHLHVLPEREIAAILGLPLGTVQWRCKRAHDHLRQVMTHRTPPPLAATVRGVKTAMGIRVLKTVPPGEKVSYTVWETVDWAEAVAASPVFRIPASLRSRLGDVEARLGRRATDAHIDSIGLLARLQEREVTIQCTPPDVAPDPRKAMTVIYLGAADIGIDQDTQVGGRSAHWTQVDARHHIEWPSVTGAYWMVTGFVTPEELRGIAEAIEAEARTGPA